MRATFRTLLTAVVAAALLASCLTRALWNWSDPDAVPDLDTATTECRVDAVLTVPDADPIEPGSYAIGFAPVGGDRPPRHLSAQAGDGSAWLLVRPRTDFPATTAMPAFRPRSYELDVFDGQHLRRGSNNVRMTIHGSVPPAALGEMLPADRAARVRQDPLLADQKLIPWGPVRRALDGLQRQSWTRLLAPAGPPQPEGTPAPIAFVGPDGRPVPAMQMSRALLAPSGDPLADFAAHSSVLARVSEHGREVVVRIPVPVLLNADSMSLRRDGAVIAFAWARRGVGRFARPDALPADLVAFDLPLSTPTLSYEWSREIPAESGWKTPIQLLLTPFTAILDILIESAPPLRALRDWLFPPAETMPLRQPDGGR